MNRNIRRWLIGLIIILVISAGGAIMATKTLALSNNKSYQAISFTINQTDEQKLTAVPPTGKLTAEQEKQIQDIQEQKYKINSSLISFVSGYTTLKSPGIEQNIDTDMEYYVLQFYMPLNKVDPETRDKLAMSGVVLVDYIPDNAFYAKIPPSAFESIIPLINNNKIRYVGPIPPQAKISQELVSEVQKNSEAIYKIVVHLFKEPTVDELNNLKGYMKIYSYSDVTHFVYGDAEGYSVSKIYSLSFVKLIENSTPLKLFTDNIGNNANDTYIVIFKEWTPDNKNQVLSVEGVHYVRDTTFGDKGYPAIIVIISNQSSVGKIKDLNFIYDVQKVVQSKNVMPKSTNGFEFSIILIVIILLSYKVRRKNK